MTIAFGVTCDMTVDAQSATVKTDPKNAVSVRGVSSRSFSTFDNSISTRFSTTAAKTDTITNSNDDVQDVVCDVLGYLLKIKPVMICFQNVCLIDQSSGAAITRLITLQCKSLFVFTASPVTEQFNYPMFQSSPHLIKQQPSANRPSDLNRFASRNYLKWYTGLREALLMENGAHFNLIDKLDKEDLQDKLKSAIVVSRLNGRISNNDKEYETLLDIPKVSKLILQYTGTITSSTITSICSGNSIRFRWCLSSRCQYLLVSDVPGTY